MALYIRKNAPVEARQYEEETPLHVVSHSLGEQTAKKGDWLVGNERGKVTVVTAAKFAEEYERFVLPEVEPEKQLEETPEETSEETSEPED